MTWVKFHPISLPHPLWSREPRLDLPLDLGEYHGKFGDVSSYRKQMHKEQIRKIRKFSAVFQKMWGISHPSLGHADPVLTFPRTSGYAMESLVTLALTGTKCIKNRQTDRHSSLYR